MDSNLFILPINGNTKQPMYTNSMFLLRNKLRSDNSCRMAAVNWSNEDSDPQPRNKRVKLTENYFDAVGIGQIPALDKVTNFTSFDIRICFGLDFPFYRNFV